MLGTTNVLAFSLDPAVLEERLGFAPGTLVVNGGAPTSMDAGGVETFALTKNGLVPATTSSARRYGPIISILNTPHPLRLVVGTRGSSSSNQHLMDIARRIAYDAWLYGKVDCEIVRDEDFDAEAEESEGNVVLLGDAFANSVTATWAEWWPVPGTLSLKSLLDVLTSTFLQSLSSRLSHFVSARLSTAQRVTVFSPLPRIQGSPPRWR